MLFYYQTDCSQDITADKGEIITPYYNTQYPNKVDCAWTITVDAGQKDFVFKFTAFDLEESEDCNADYVEIRNGTKQTAPLIGNASVNFSSSHVPPPPPPLPGQSPGKSIKKK